VALIVVPFIASLKCAVTLASAATAVPTDGPVELTVGAVVSAPTGGGGVPPFALLFPLPPHPTRKVASSNAAGHSSGLVNLRYLIKCFSE
jgi:hypothetical protein